MGKTKNVLHVIGPDTKNSYGIMTQIHKRFDMSQHHFLIAAHKNSIVRYPKLNDFCDLEYMPDGLSQVQQLTFLYKKFKSADLIVMHSLFFTTQKYLIFLYVFRNFLKKAIWIEWGADLYSWKINRFDPKSLLLNHMNRKVREAFPAVGLVFPTDEEPYRKQFGAAASCFFTPMPNPMPGATELMDYIDAQKPEKKLDPKNIRVQIAHNSFQFNNHIRILNKLEQYKERNIKLILPLSYGKYGINGQYGGTVYVNAVKQYAKDMYKEKCSILERGMEFSQYVKYLWNIDIIVFDVDRPCGLGNLRILLYMGKKVFLPANNPYYEFFKSKGIQIFNTNDIPNMTFEEFAEPVQNQNLTWIKDYLNNNRCLDYWEEMFKDIGKRTAG